MPMIKSPKPIDLGTATVVKNGAADTALQAAKNTAIASISEPPKPERRRRATPTPAAPAEKWKPPVNKPLDLSKFKNRGTDFTDAEALPKGFKMPKTIPASNVYYVLRHGSQFVRTYKIQHDKRTMTYTPKLKLACEFQFKDKAIVAGGMLPGAHRVCEVIDFGGDIGLVVFGAAYGPYEDGRIRLS